jgi:anti-sigma regulatory factor (Ser/Thr protein kinase)
VTTANWSFSADAPQDARGRRRAYLAHLRARCSPESDLEAAEIIYGELIGNVIRHARGPIRIAVEWEAGWALLRVRDAGPGFRNEFRRPPESSESGRGLFMVRDLAKTLEIVCDENGCEVRAVLPVSTTRCSSSV